MRAPLKRLPVDRARHVKRLEGDDGVTSLSTPTAATTITTIVSSSTKVIVFANPSNTSSSTSTSTSTSALMLQPITATPAPEDKSSSVPQPTMAPSNATPSVTSKSTKLSSGGITGIALAVTIVLAILVFLLLRWKIIGMRNKKTTTWGGNMYPKFKQHTNIEKSAVGAPYAFRHEAASSFSPDLPRPPTSYNNPAPTSYNNSASKPKSVTPSASPDQASNVPAARTATVRCTFIPSLPDELSISNGEIVRIVSEYDDGWALCANTRDEQGMVPLECLQKATAGAPGESTEATDWRNAQRASSLASRRAGRY